MKIRVIEPWFKADDYAVFTKTVDGYKLLYWACNHNIQNYECINCALALESEDE